MKWTCRCGEVEAEVDVNRGIRAVCYCKYCRDFATRTGAAGTLDPAGGSDLYQVAPEQVQFTKGVEKLAWTRLTVKGPLRWVTTCCGTPVANTLATRAIPFVTLQSHGFKAPDQLGPVKIRVFRESATGTTSEGGMGPAALYLNFAGRALRSRLSGGWRRNPFFTEDDKPVGPKQDL